jgi:hypothetical protein
MVKLLLMMMPWKLQKMQNLIRCKKHMPQAQWLLRMRQEHRLKPDRLI